MAIDTRNKRMSMIGLFSPVPAVLPNPDGTIGTQDRAMLEWLYHGLALDAPEAAVICDVVLSDEALYGMILADSALYNVVLADDS